MCWSSAGLERDPNHIVLVLSAFSCSLRDAQHLRTSDMQLVLTAVEIPILLIIDSLRHSGLSLRTITWIIYSGLYRFLFFTFFLIFMPALPRAGLFVRLSVHSFVRSFGQILLPRYPMNGLNNFDKTYQECSLVTIITFMAYILRPVLTLTFDLWPPESNQVIVKN